MPHHARIGTAAVLAIAAALAAPRALAFEDDKAPALDRMVGARVMDFTLKDAVSRADVRLHGFAGKAGAVLVFVGAECPVGDLYYPRLVELHREYGPRGIVFLAISSNVGDSLEEIAARAKEFGLDFPILKDTGNRVADALMAERTPEVVLLDGEARIRYRGAIDDQYVIGKRKPDPTRHHLREAIDAVLARRPVEVTGTEVAGCLIERAEPKTETAKADAPRVRAPSDEIRALRDANGPDPEHVGPVTFASDAATIIQEKCQSCHRPGQVAPFPLTNYDEIRKRSAMIREVVDDRRMPPWHADPRHGAFANDRSLSADQRARLLAWIDQGTPLGDVKNLPPARTFPEGWSIGEPDVVFEIPETQSIPPQGVLDYVRVRVPSNFKEDVWVRAAEAVPSDRTVVHHIIVYVDDHGQRRQPGGGAHLCGYAPGDMPTNLAEGTAKRIPAGADFIFELHYTPNGKPRQDRSKLGLIFAREPVTREARTLPIAELGFVIPPGEPNVPVTASFKVPREVRLLSLMPHMHVRGKDFKYVVTPPGGQPETVLSVPAYDFGWQSYYTLKEPMTLPAGAIIECTAHFDNSADNPSNPDPTKTVRWGDQTFEEMMIGYIDIDFPVGEGLTRAELREGRRPSPGAAALVQSLIRRGVRANDGAKPVAK